MKKYLMGIFALVLAIGLFAFTKKEKPPFKLKTNYVWFDVKPNPAFQTTLTNSEVTYNSALSAAPATCPAGCSPTNTYICTVGFNQNQVSGTSLNGGPQPIQATYYRRTNP